MQTASAKKTESKTKSKRSLASDAVAVATKTTIIPTAKIQGVQGSQFLSVTFKNADDKILTSPGSLIYMKGDVEKGEVTFGGGAIRKGQRKAKNAMHGGGLMSKVGRIFAGESLFLTSYMGSNRTLNTGEIGLSLDTPGDVLEIKLRPGEQYRISGNSFLACTTNVELETSFNARGLLGVGQEEGAVLPVLQCKGPGPGRAWISTFGAFEKHVLEEGESMLIDNGVFLMAPKSLDYTIEQLGRTWTSSFFGNEGYGMRFVGPKGGTTLYIQTKNLKNFVESLNLYVKKKN